MLTGLYPHQNGVLSNKHPHLEEGLATFPELFKKRGYACGMVGKWHLGNEHQPQLGFNDTWVTLTAPTGGYQNPVLWIDGREVAHAGHLTNILTDYAISFVEQHATEPFLLWLTYKAPHQPCEPPPGWQRRYRPDTLPLPASMADDLSTKPGPQREAAAHRRFQATSDRQIQQSLSKHYALISSLDHNIGRIIDRLQQLNLDQQTLLVFMSDNGFLYGQHQMWGKGPAVYEELVRSPLIVWWPGHIRPGTRIDALVSSLDLFPTLAGRAGIAAPDGIAGVDIWPLLTGRSSAMHPNLFFEYYHHVASDSVVPLRGLVTLRHKYVSYLQDGEELYDLQTDPGEMDNLIDDPAYRDLADSLRQGLSEWRARTGDTL